VVKYHPLLVGAALFAAITPSPNVASQAVGKSSPTPLPLPANDYSMGRAPQNCPMVESNLIHVAHNNQPNVVPHTYWWIGRGALVGYSGWQVSQHRVFQTFGVRTKYGYPQKVAWQLTTGASGPVTLRGWNLRTSQPVSFGRPLPEAHPQPLVTPPVIAWPAGIVRDHRAPSLIFVSIAGCYVIQAQWKTGSWTLPFAAGCVSDRRLVGVAHCR